ncbi:CBM96 family carbohydrate-binding protein [Pedosphaera parvula]|uniref:Carbohydrate-binding module family 96 domain-containing protein n=1 Tax=Pedosphaera parvula (strain Ellin514) TaxID=320771 RepID=B9XP49_PEDPL|nr:hypothetical protein [Pedosphaera parvula]EEF58405.1 hypothetical protein Cflav_PD6148 [Pedosphaera parvula Ellin514]
MLAVIQPVFAGTISLIATTNQLGPTPTILGYNSGHFYPGSNTRDWWRYSGVNGARFFLPTKEFEPFSSSPPAAVTNQTSFLAQRDALRVDPARSPWIDWPAFTNRFEHEPLGGMVFGYALREVRHLNLQVCAQITGTQFAFPIAGSNDWSGQWKFWLHCYAQAFYLARQFDVQRFQYFNEPNHSNAGGITVPDYFRRFQLASDAFQSAIVDVNRLQGKSLIPIILAPVSAGSPDGIYPAWGRPLVQNRHLNFLGLTNSNFSLLHKYDYHQYNSAPERFGVTASNLNMLIARDTSPEKAPPLTLTEFNVHTAGKFLELSETLDSPSQYPQLAAKVINLFDNSADELYCFKFSQTDYRLGIKKNGTHYVDNTNAPYNIGTITKAGEVWRLINKGFKAGRTRLELTYSSSSPSFYAAACYDPSNDRHYILSANTTNKSMALTLDLAAWNIPSTNHLLIEEVSEACYGGVKSWKPLKSNRALSEIQPPDSVWLITVSTRPETQSVTIPVSEFASIRDGKYKNTAYLSGSMLRIQNNSTNADYRAVTYLKFHLPSKDRTNIQSAFLDLTAHTVNNAPLAYAHIYAIDGNSVLFTSSLSWSTSPNLLQNVPGGNTYTNNFIMGAGDSAHLIGQLVAIHKPRQQLIDLTDYVRHTTNTNLTFLLVRQNGFQGDDADASALAISSKSEYLPSLTIVR